MHFVRSRKMQKFFNVSQNFALIYFSKSAKMSRNKRAKSLGENHKTITQSRDFHKLSFTINCCSYVFRGLFFRETIFFAKYRIVFSFFALFVFAKKCESSRKSFRNTNENIAFFGVRFCSLETLLESSICSRIQQFLGNTRIRIKKRNDENVSHNYILFEKLGKVY